MVSSCPGASFANNALGGGASICRRLSALSGA